MYMNLNFISEAALKRNSNNKDKMHDGRSADMAECGPNSLRLQRQW